MNHYYYPQCGSNGTFWKLCVLYHEEWPELIVFENDQAWKAKLTKADLQAQPKYNSNNYEDKLKTFFASPPENGKFEFKAGCFKILLPLEGDLLHMVFFNCRLTQVNLAENALKLLDEFYASDRKNANELATLRQQHALAESANETMKKKLNEFLERRESETISLHNDFLAILNEKKRHIQHLNDLLLAFRQGRPTVNPAVEVKRRKKSAPAKRRNLPAKKTSPLPSSESEQADSDAESKYNTDDSASSPRARNNSPIPSTSATEDHAFVDREPQLGQLPRRIPVRDMIQEEERLPSTPIQEQISTSFNENEALSDTKEEDYVYFNTQDLLDNA